MGLGPAQLGAAILTIGTLRLTRMSDCRAIFSRVSADGHRKQRRDLSSVDHALLYAFSGALDPRKEGRAGGSHAGDDAVHPAEGASAREPVSGQPDEQAF